MLRACDVDREGKVSGQKSACLVDSPSGASYAEPQPRVPRRPRRSARLARGKAVPARLPLRGPQLMAFGVSGREVEMLLLIFPHLQDFTNTTDRVYRN